jgi:DNA replication protein DnaC
MTAAVDPQQRQTLEREGVPLPSLAALFDKADALRETAGLVAVRRFLEERAARPWLALLGAPGTGKTVAAAAALIAARDEDGRSVFGATAWTSWADIVGFEIWSPRLRELAAARVLLVVDDVGHKGADKVEAVALPRYDRLRPTIFTTNLSASAFEEAHPRIFDRLHEVGRIIEVPGPSLRRVAPPEGLT